MPVVLHGAHFLPFSLSPPSPSHKHAHRCPHSQVLRLCGEMVEDMGRGCAMQFLGKQLLQVGVGGGAWIQIYLDPDPVVA